MGKLENTFFCLFLRVLPILSEKPKGDKSPFSSHIPAWTAVLKLRSLYGWLGFPADDWADWTVKKKDET